MGSKGAKVAWGIFLVLLLGFLAGSIPRCVPPTVARKSQLVTQRGKMSQISLALRMHAGDHGGVYPASLDAIMECNDLEPSFFDFQKIGDAVSARVWYARGATEVSDGKRLVLAHPFALERGKSRMVAFPEGRVEMIDEAEFQRLVGAQEPDWEK
jgi:hypothetical protein